MWYYLRDFITFLCLWSFFFSFCVFFIPNCSFRFYTTYVTSLHTTRRAIKNQLKIHCCHLNMNDDVWLALTCPLSNHLIHSYIILIDFAWSLTFFSVCFYCFFLLYCFFSLLVDKDRCFCCSSFLYYCHCFYFCWLSGVLRRCKETDCREFILSNNLKLFSLFKH